MKQLFTLFAGMLFPLFLNAQVVNGSFENTAGPDLSGWSWTCMAESQTGGAPGSGNYSLKVFSGNLQGCFPGYAYQEIPGILPGALYELRAWAYSETTPAGIYFGTLNNGVISLQSGDTTSQSTWTQLQVISAFNLATGDTPVVVLSGGLTTGPVQGYGYFDLVQLSLLSGVQNIDPDLALVIYPNPVNDQLNVQTKKEMQNAGIRVENVSGQLILERTRISGKIIKLDVSDLASGVYHVRIVQDGTTTGEGSFVVAGK